MKKTKAIRAPEYDDEITEVMSEFLDKLAVLHGQAPNDDTSAFGSKFMCELEEFIDEKVREYNDDDSEEFQLTEDYWDK